MSIGSLGIVGGLAGTNLPQRAAETEKTSREATDQARTTQASERAEQAAGIGQTEEDSQAQDRDADGRRPWEQPPTGPAKPAETLPADQSPAARSKDPTGSCGAQLDIDG